MKPLAIIFILIPLVSFSQVDFGIKGFVNSCIVRGMNPRLSGSGGIYLQENISKHFSLRQEVLFSLNGYNTIENLPNRVSITNTGDTIITPVGNRKVFYNFNYLEIPTMAILKAGNKIKPYFLIGGSLKAGIYSKKRISSEYIQGEQTFYNINSTGFDVTVLSGIGFESKIKDTQFHIEGRYSKGFISQFNGYKFDTLSLLIGIKI